MSVARRVPAIVLVAVLALLPLQAWLRASQADVTYATTLDGLDGITWTGTVSPDGTLSVQIVYDLDDDEVREASIRLPSGARFLRADGVPVPSASGRYADVDAQGPLTVTYERVGAVTRYSDGVIVDFAGVASSDMALFPCARCYLGIDGYGDTSLIGALFADDLTGARIALGGVDQARADVDDGGVRFVGVIPGADEASLLAWLPVAAAPDAPTVSGVPGAVTGETAAQVWDATLDAADALAEPGDDAPIGRLAAAVVLSVMWLVVAAWILWRIVADRRVMAAERPAPTLSRDASFSPPSSLEPALVGVLVGATGRGRRSAVAATLLELARREVIRIDGVDSRRYRLTIPAGAKGTTTFEEAVLAELRPQGQVSSTATLTGPPLWGAAGKAAAGRLTRVATGEAKRSGLVRVTLSAWVLIPASLAMGIVAVIASGGSSWLAWTITLAGPVVALVATLLTGVSLTADGRAEREQWLEYGDWLRTNSELGRVGAPGIATWGEPLVYGTVLGAAPVAAEALGLD